MDYALFWILFVPWAIFSWTVCIVGFVYAYRYIRFGTPFIDYRQGDPTGPAESGTRDKK